MSLPHPLCLLRTVAYSIRGWLANVPAVFAGNIVATAPIRGHSFLLVERHHGCTVEVCRCELCGEVSITWQHGEPTPGFMGQPAERCACWPRAAGEAGAGKAVTG